MNSDRVDGANGKILIVDDTPDNLRLLYNTLTEQGYEVQCAINGELALVAATIDPPDLILLDIKMPQIDGYEVCQRLKASELTRQTPIIFLSALDETIDKVRAFQVGGVDYIAKPFQIEEVLVRVQNQLALQASRAEILKLNAELEARVKQRTDQLKLANKALAREKAHLVAAQKVAHVGSWEFDVLTQEILWSEETFLIWGLDPQQPPPTYAELIAQQIHPHDREFWENTVNQAILDGKPHEFEYRILRSDGSIRNIFAQGRPILNESGQVVRLFGTVLDITDRKIAEAALRKSEEQFRLTFELAPIGIAIQNLDGKFIQVNQALCEALGYTRQELGEKTWLDLTHADDVPVSLALHQKIYAGEISDFQIENRYWAKDNQLVYGILEVAVVQDAKGEPLHLIGQFLDITARKRAEEQLVFDALHDAVTLLPNRTLFMERLELALKKAKRQEDYLFAVLFIDLDRFKVVNDSLGHQFGDQLLIAIARQLENWVRATDMVARLGGDEFVILLDELSDINDAIRIADRISEKLKTPFFLEGRQVFTSTSIGIVLSSTDYHHGSELLRDADIAMYRAKEAGKARYEVFDREMHAQALRQLQLEQDLRQALERQEFLVHYQPIISLQTGKITGFEALLRWLHPSRGLISPTEFIPIAEETGLIVAIGKWVLTQACYQLQTWRSQHQIQDTWHISVNLSSKQLREPALIRQIEQILAETGLNGSCLELELTESMLIDNVETVISTLSQLRSKSIQLSIDDFGTGYSSLSYLHRFPINTLKIDRSFVSRMGEELEIVRTIITLAHQLGMDAIAEGVENQQQLNQLKILGCDRAQGYFFSQPLAAESVEVFLTEFHDSFYS